MPHDVETKFMSNSWSNSYYIVSQTLTHGRPPDLARHVQLMGSQAIMCVH